MNKSVACAPAIENSRERKLSLSCLISLTNFKETYTQQHACRIFTSIEKNGAVLKQEIELIIKKAYEYNSHYDPVDFDAYNMFCTGIEHTSLYMKYEMIAMEMFGQNDPEHYMLLLKYTFPDLFYAVLKDYPYGFKAYSWLSVTYENFKPILSNIAILGLLPKGKKYGGFVKVLLHANSMFSFESTLASGLRFYMYGVLEVDRRENYFDKFEIDEKDCALWSDVFNEKFPDYADVHKFFDQIA